jgi:protein-tyrosine phosphatase
MTAAQPYRVCFVCSGNICRSPMAEAVLRRMVAEAGLADRVAVSSAGTGGWHVGDAADPRAVTALGRRGYALQHQARQWQPVDFADADMVVALDGGHYRQLVRMAPDPGERAKVRRLRSFDPAGGDDLDVPDPYYGGAGGFEQVLDLVEAGCAGILDEIRSALEPPGPPRREPPRAGHPSGGPA